jgi:hypothetical protein
MPLGEGRKRVCLHDLILSTSFNIIELIIDAIDRGSFKLSV